MRLKPVQMGSKNRDVWAYINSSNVEIYWTEQTVAGTQTHHMKLLKSEIRKLAPFCKLRRKP